MTITYRKLVADEFAQAMDIRIKVFVEEQQVPIEEEQDELDAEAIHFGAFLKDRMVGTGRLVVKDDQGKLGRFAILKELRGQGIGKDLIQTIIDFGSERGIKKFSLGAQLHAIPFYEKIGFKVKGDVFMDGGLPHRPMYLVVEDRRSVR